MNRTIVAAASAGVIAFAAVAGFGWFLGFGAAPSVVAGVVLGILGALLLLGASRRADSFQTPGAPIETPTRPQPGEPSPPASGISHDRTDDRPEEDDTRG